MPRFVTKCLFSVKCVDILEPFAALFSNLKKEVPELVDGQALFSHMQEGHALIGFVNNVLAILGGSARAPAMFLQPHVVACSPANMSIFARWALSHLFQKRGFYVPFSASCSQQRQRGAQNSLSFLALLIFRQHR